MTQGHSFALTNPAKGFTVAGMDEIKNLSTTPNAVYLRMRYAAIRDGTWRPWSEETKARARLTKRWPRCTLTEAAVREILASSESHAELGRRYGVTRQAIHHIRNRKTWRHIGDGS